MTKRELIQEYVSGRIDRRDFMVRLTGLGVSGAAALAYAQSLTPSVSAASVRRDPNGFIIRSASGEYGPGGIFKAILELLKFAFKFLQSVIDLLLELLANLLAASPTRGARLFAPIAVGDTLPNGGTVTQDDVDQLKTMLNQLKEHQAAVKAAFADFGGTAPSTSSSASATGDLTTLADKLNTLVSIQAAVIPTISGDGPKTTALRITLTTAALVARPSSRRPSGRR